MKNNKELQPSNLAETPTRTSRSFGRVVKQVQELIHELQVQQLMLKRQNEDLRRVSAEKQALEDLLRKYREELDYWASLGPVCGGGHV